MADRSRIKSITQECMHFGKIMKVKYSVHEKNNERRINININRSGINITTNRYLKKEGNRIIYMWEGNKTFANNNQIEIFEILCG